MEKTKYAFYAIRKDRSTGDESIVTIEDFLERIKGYWKIDDGLMDDFIQGMTIWTPYAEYRISY
jgi:hypothetical protein